MIQVSPATSFKASTDEASGHVWGALVTDATFSVQAQADGRGELLKLCGCCAGRHTQQKVCFFIHHGPSDVGASEGPLSLPKNLGDDLLHI